MCRIWSLFVGFQTAQFIHPPGKCESLDLCPGFLTCFPECGFLCGSQLHYSSPTGFVGKNRTIQNKMTSRQTNLLETGVEVKETDLCMCIVLWVQHSSHRPQRLKVPWVLTLGPRVGPPSLNPQKICTLCIRACQLFFFLVQREFITSLRFSKGLVGLAWNEWFNVLVSCLVKWKKLKKKRDMVFPF